ncbi:MAG: hypothetical protein JSY10_29255, partial [Paenibacillus sp.]|nr:hypothetical protein [Paenibacillus sp.]
YFFFLDINPKEIFNLLFSPSFFILQNKMLATRNISRLSNLVKFSRRNYGLPASAIGVGSDPRKDKTVQLTPLRGVNIIHDPLLSKGTAFSIAERERLSIRGLVPPRCQEMDKQLLRIKRNLDALETPLAKFVFLSALQDRNEILFYKLLINYLDELSGIIYTPTGKVIYIKKFLPTFSRISHIYIYIFNSVGEACLMSHSIYRRSRGMYFSSQDRGAMSAMVHNWPHDEVDVIVVTDGSRVLGLGDLGANGMQIPIGKLSLVRYNSKKKIHIVRRLNFFFLYSMSLLVVFVLVLYFLLFWT